MQQLPSCVRNESCNFTKRSRHQGEDMISTLPDFIIGYILNFLSTKEAVLTSVLSKRWKYMWKYVTKLHFNNHGSHPHHSSFTLKYFPKFVTRVLFHLSSATIEKFTLVVEDFFSECYINQWISAALDRRVKKIYVYSLDDYGNQINLSSYPLFESHSLEELVFSGIGSSCIIKLRSFVCLPCLTVLKLHGIVFTSYSSNELKELTLNLPLLREYETRNCTCRGIKSITIEAALLELVEMMNPRSEIIKFCGSHIKKFTHCCDISSQTILLDDQHIPSAELRIYSYKASYKTKSVEEIWTFLRKLLRLFVNAELLHVSFPNDRIKSLAVEHYLAGMPAFQMLGHLRLNKVTCDVLLAFLLKSPCLKTLDLKVVVDLGERYGPSNGLLSPAKMAYYEAKWKDFAIVPDCFLCTLKAVKFYEYSGGECELSFVKFVMENAKVLERIIFSFHLHLSCSTVEKAKEMLSCLVTNSFNRVIMEFYTNNPQDYLPSIKI